jgi:hypothetical protein
VTDKNLDIRKEMDIVEKIRALPRYGPRLMFRMKVELMAAFPSLEFGKAKHGTAKHGWGPRSEWTRPGRLVATGAMAHVVAFLIFSSLVLVSGGSTPGSPLYGLKKVREQLGLALTWGQAGKAQRYLDLASARLEELDSISVKGAVDPSSVESIAKDYGADTAAVALMLKQNPGAPESQDIARRLQLLQTQKANMVQRLSAEAPGGVQASAGGATVEVKDSAGTGVLGAAGSVQGTASNKGALTFDANVTDRSQLSGLDAVIENDGRKEVVPLFDGTAGNSSYNVRVEPAVRVVALNQPTMFTINVSGKNGASAAFKRIKLTDGSNTSTIDGRSGEAVLTLDGVGSATFSVTKTSDEASSRIGLQVEDGGWVDAGQALTLGAVDTPGGPLATGGVAATSFGSSTDPQSVEMANATVKVTARRNTDGEIVSSITRNGGATTAGPLRDTLPVEGRAVGGFVTVDGPRLAFVNGKAAGYEMTLELKTAGASVKKTYTVTLSDGDAFAAVKCDVTVTGSAEALLKSRPALLTTDVLSTPAGAALMVGGKEARLPATGENGLFSFEIGNPYVAYAVNNDVVFAAYPIDSGTYPQGWSVNATSVSPMLTNGTSVYATGRNTTMILGITSRASLEAMVTKARSGIGDATTITSGSAPAVQSNNGFTVLTSPQLEQVAKGKQKITVRVYKQYELVFK